MSVMLTADGANCSDRRYCVFNLAAIILAAYAVFYLTLDFFAGITWAALVAVPMLFIANIMHQVGLLAAPKHLLYPITLWVPGFTNGNQHLYHNHHHYHHQNQYHPLCQSPSCAQFLRRM